MKNSSISELIEILTANKSFLHKINELESAIELGPENYRLHWELGLAYFLDKDEETAQLIWLNSLASLEENQSISAIDDLTRFLKEAAVDLNKREYFELAYIIRKYICHIDNDINNIIEFLNLSFKLNSFEISDLEKLDIYSLLNARPIVEHIEDLNSLFINVIQIPSQEAIQFSEVCYQYLQADFQWSEVLVYNAKYFAFERKLVQYAAALLEVCLAKIPDHLGALSLLARLYSDLEKYSAAVEIAYRLCEQSESDQEVFCAKCVLLSALARQGDWAKIKSVANDIEKIILEFDQTNISNLSYTTLCYLIVNSSKFLYLRDDIELNKRIQNIAGNLFIRNIEANVKVNHIQSQDREKARRRLRVGYIGSTLRNHSVGWLSRWLFKYHNYEAIDVYIFLVQQRQNHPFFEEWFLNSNVNVSYVSDDVSKAAQEIREADLDILVDLDSATLDHTCSILALKPTVTQVTWLGFDSSGLPSIDYFIADPFVLPEDAQVHYREKIWRLPQTYIAVDGFEVHTPTIRRSELNIPNSSVVFWSSQASLKRNPEMVKLQMKILKEVPNSYFLIKGFGDLELLQGYFNNIAKAEGVSEKRLRFLPVMSNEYIHRANLALADIVLDTYPYNGATTTLETLWMEIPIVTKVGKQFSARNSYAFMMNAGIQEGIAWTDEEYIEWGIRLGTDEVLRQNITWKLKQSKHSSPLWNAKNFTKHMEDAFFQMWRNDTKKII